MHASLAVTLVPIDGAWRLLAATHRSSLVCRSGVRRGYVHRRSNHFHRLLLWLLPAVVRIRASVYLLAVR